MVESYQQPPGLQGREKRIPTPAKEGGGTCTGPTAFENGDNPLSCEKISYVQIWCQIIKIDSDEQVALIL
jgi:hypothetical protein